MSPTYEVEWSLSERGTVMVKAPSAEAAKEKFYLMSATELSASARRSDLECEVIE